MVFEGKNCVYEDGKIDPIEQRHNKQYKLSQGLLRQDMVKKRSSSSICEPRRNHAFFEEPPSSSLLLLDSASLKAKYFEEKARLRQILIKGFDDESDDREEEEEEEEEEERGDCNPHAGTNINLGANSASFDEGFSQEARDREKNWKDISSSSPLVFDKGRIHYHTSFSSAASSHESDNEQVRVQRINRKRKFNKLDSIQRHVSPSTDTSSHENESRRKYPMERSRQKGCFDNNYSRHYSHSSNYSTSFEESWIRHPGDFSDSRQSTIHYIGHSTNKYDMELQPRTCIRKQLPYSYDSALPMTLPQHAIHHGQLRNGSLSKCEEPKPNQYHMNQSYETEQNHRAQMETHLDDYLSIKMKKGQLQRISFDDRIKALKRFKKDHGHVNIPTDKKTLTGKLGYWLKRARRDLELRELGLKPRKFKLLDWKWDALKKLMDFDADTTHRKSKLLSLSRVPRISFDELLTVLRKYKDTHGNLNVETNTSSCDNYLGAWLMRAREDLELFEMGCKPLYFFPADEGQWDILKELGVTTISTIHKWKKYYNRMASEENMVQRVVDVEAPSIYNHGDFFYRRVEELKRFKKDKGHFNVPVCGDVNMTLGLWCRAVKKAVLDLQEGRTIVQTPKPVAILGAEMNPQRFRILEQIGFISDIIDNQDKVIEVE